MLRVTVAEVQRQVLKQLGVNLSAMNWTLGKASAFSFLDLAGSGLAAVNPKFSDGTESRTITRQTARAKGLRCGLDVYEGYPGTDGAWSTPLAALPGGAFTHHCGASTDQAQRAVGDEVVRLVQVLRDTGRLENCVNQNGKPRVEVKTAGAAGVRR